MNSTDEGHRIDLSSLGDTPPYFSGPTSPTTRMPFHGDESFARSPQLSPEMPGSSFVRGKAYGMQSSAQLLPDGGQPLASPARSVSFSTTPMTVHQSYPSPEFRSPRRGSTVGWTNRRSSRCCTPRWHPSFSMYVCFVFGILCAVGHHIFYTSLDGQIADNQSGMLRYGTLLAYGAKAGFSAAVVSAFKQRVWVTVRSRFMSIKGLDSMFAAAEDMVAMLDFEFMRDAKAAYALALFAWTTPLVVILTSNTLLVEPRTLTQNTTCPAVRTLNFTFEETYEWRAPVKIDGLYEVPVSIWNTTKRDDDSDPNWFDYYTGPSPAFQSIATLGAFLEEVVPRKNASFDTCGTGWNCTFAVEFTAPGYKCTELASGVGATPRNLTQESGEAVPPFPDTDFLLPRGNYSYYAFTSGGEYSPTQMKSVGVGGIPEGLDPSEYPADLGALRTEPVIWIGYSVVNHPNQTQPFRNESAAWADAFTPKILACEHRETSYVANFTYVDAQQFARIERRTFGAPVINTTFLPGVMARDGTDDNTTATPAANYVLPRDTARYRRAAAYHSLGKMLRGFLNGTVAVSDALVQAIENTPAVQTKLLDQRNNYFPYPDLPDRVRGLYDDVLLSMFSNPQLVEVAWAQRPGEMSGMRSQGGASGGDSDSDDDDEAAYMYPCTRYRTANSYAYHRRDLWLVYGIAAVLTLVCIAAGALAIRDNGGVTRNTRFSSVVAATRGPALEKIAWQGPLQDRGDVPSEVKRLRLGYGVMSDMSGGGGVGVGGKLGVMEMEPDPNLDVGVDDEVAQGATSGGAGRSRWYSSGFASDMRCGFGLKGDVDQRHREGSLFHR